jgi:hypothetical protein
MRYISYYGVVPAAVLKMLQEKASRRAGDEHEDIKIIEKYHHLVPDSVDRDAAAGIRSG